MTRKAWLLIGIAYLALAIGAIVSLRIFSDQQNQIEDQGKRLAVAAGVYCEIGRLNEPGEVTGLHKLAQAINRARGSDLDPKLLIRTPDCITILRSLDQD